MRSMPWMSVALVPVLSGCLVMRGARSVEVEEQERIAVRFESSTAADVFFEALARSSREDHTDERGFAVPFLAIGGETIFHETRHFNAQVRMADVDRDGNISQTEAAAYLDRVRTMDEVGA